MFGVLNNIQKEQFNSFIWIPFIQCIEITKKPFPQHKAFGARLYRKRLFKGTYVPSPRNTDDELWLIGPTLSLGFGVGGVDGAPADRDAYGARCSPRHVKSLPHPKGPAHGTGTTSAMASNSLKHACAVASPSCAVDAKRAMVRGVARPQPQDEAKAGPHSPSLNPPLVQSRSTS